MAPVRAENLPPYGVLLVDEVHRQKTPESLFPMMDRGLLTFVTATTMPEKLDSAFRSRFLFTARLRPYTKAQMSEIMNVMLKDPQPVNSTAAVVFTSAAAGNPRTMEKIVRMSEAIDSLDPNEVLKALGITADGLTHDHFDFLAALDLASRPLGLNQAARNAWLTVEEAIHVERLLVTKGFVEQSASGRALTMRGKQYVDKLKEDGIWDES
jgi:Holliday junction resolvasome RuvABC ATP-dependent DNA helicase subunit